MDIVVFYIVASKKYLSSYSMCACNFLFVFLCMTECIYTHYIMSLLNQYSILFNPIDNANVIYYSSISGGGGGVAV